MKLLAREFKETAKIFIPVYVASLILIYFRRDSIINLYTKGLEYHSFLENLAIIFCIIIIILPLFLSVKRFYNCVKSTEINGISSSAIIISKMVPMALWSLGILLLDFGLSQPTVLDKMIKDPDYFDDINYYLFNPFTGGFDIELIDFYIVRTIVDSIECFLLISIVILIFYICVCLAKIVSKRNDKIITAFFIIISLYPTILGVSYVSNPMMFLRETFKNYSELYGEIYASCIGIPLQIIIYIILFFICKKLIEKVILKTDEDLAD